MGCQVFNKCSLMIFPGTSVCFVHQVVFDHIIVWASFSFIEGNSDLCV